MKQKPLIVSFISGWLEKKSGDLLPAAISDSIYNMEGRTIS